MKNIYIILALFFGLQTYAQKTIYIYNLSSTNFDIGEIGTQPVSGTQPVFTSSPSGGMITIAPYSLPYILEATPASTTKFPFYSPSTSPVIDFWIRHDPPNNPATLPSNLVGPIYGASQIFQFIKFQVGPRGSLGGTTFYPIHPSYDSIYSFGLSGTVSLDIIDAVSGLPAADGETFII